MHKLSLISSMVDGVADAVRATRGTCGIKRTSTNLGGMTDTSVASS